MPTVAAQSSSKSAEPTATPPPTVHTSPSPAPPAPTPTLTAEELRLAATLDEIGARVSSLRELPSLRPIERRFMTREELIARLLQDLDEDREEIYQAQRLYAALGAIDDGEDLFETILALLGEGVLGFYEADEERFYVLKDGDGFQPLQARTYAHEFIHGVQQQHFDFQSIRDGLDGNSDAELALRALIEGDASLGTTLYMFEYMSAEERAASEPPASAALIQAFRSAPHVIQREYTFPYQDGTVFVSTLYQRGGWPAVNEAFARVPQSTEQVLHPDKYLATEPPLEVTLPDLLPTLGEGWELLVEDTLGEMVIRAYLQTGFYATNPIRAAAGWGGDRVSLYTGPGDETVLLLSALWDAEQDAQEFFDAFVQLTTARTGGEWESLGSDARLMTLPDELITVSLRNATTVVIMAPDLPTLDKVRAALG